MRRPRVPRLDLAFREDEGKQVSNAIAVSGDDVLRSGLNIAIDAMPDKEAKIVFVRLREHETAMRRNLEQIKSRAERVG